MYYLELVPLKQPLVEGLEFKNNLRVCPILVGIKSIGKSP